jgi:hypothetical protein
VLRARGGVDTVDAVADVSSSVAVAVASVLGPAADLGRTERGRCRFSAYGDDSAGAFHTVAVVTRFVAAAPLAVSESLIDACTQRATVKGGSVSAV